MTRRERWWRQSEAVRRIIAPGLKYSQAIYEESADICRHVAQRRVLEAESAAGAETLVFHDK